MKRRTWNPSRNPTKQRHPSFFIPIHRPKNPIFLGMCKGNNKKATSDQHDEEFFCETLDVMEHDELMEYIKIRKADVEEMAEVFGAEDIFVPY